MNSKKPLNERLLSLDVFRGITMFLLIADGSRLFYFLNDALPSNSIFGKLASQFKHAEWNGMHFWDLIQPYFTFIIGVAMAYSITNRLAKGESWGQLSKHMFKRCSLLFFIGIMLQSIYQERLVWDLYNILTQFSVSILLAFAVIRLPIKTQMIISITILLLMEVLYRYFPVEGYNQPFIKDHNLGTFVDLYVMGKTHPHGWTIINCVPSTAHVIWGLVTGKVLMNEKEQNQKILFLTLLTIMLLSLGYFLDWTGLSPIIKKISTSSFVFVSGGWTLASFLFIYWLIDIRGYKRWTLLFLVIGMNPIFIYLFSRTIGRSFLNVYIPIFVRGFMSPLGFHEGIMSLITFILVLGLEWYLCYWMYKRKIVIKL